MGLVAFLKIYSRVLE